MAMLRECLSRAENNGSGVYQRIINLIPPHSVYIEPFLGGGAIMRLKRPAALNIGLDLDPAAIAKFTGDPGNTATAGDAGFEFWFEQADALKFLRSYKFTGKELVYCDPPYMRSTRGRDLYKHEMTDRQHAELLKILKTLKCKVMLSRYWTLEYAHALSRWNYTSFEAMTRAGRTATESLWFNFEQTSELHDYAYTGANFRERERRKRKKLRWAGRLQRMPELERAALLAALLDVPNLHLHNRTDKAALGTPWMFEPS